MIRSKGEIFHSLPERSLPRTALIEFPVVLPHSIQQSERMLARPVPSATNLSKAARTSAPASSAKVLAKIHGWRGHSLSRRSCGQLTVALDGGVDAVHGHHDRLDHLGLDCVKGLR